MRNYLVTNRDGNTLDLGMQGENNALRIKFWLVESWHNLYGEGGRFEIWAQRSGECRPYKVSGVSSDTRYVYWTVSSEDTAVAGENGMAILHYYVGDTLAKSYTWWTIVRKGI